jgi:hypothetical protein
MFYRGFVSATFRSSGAGKNSIELANYKHFVPPGRTLLRVSMGRCQTLVKVPKTLPEKVQDWHYMVRGSNSFEFRVRSNKLTPAGFETRNSKLGTRNSKLELEWRAKSPTARLT